MDNPQFERLTPSEREVLRACLSRSNEEAARHLERGLGTIKNHMLSARTKLGGVTRTKAALLFAEYEARQKGPRQSLPISFPTPGLSGAPVDTSSAGTDRVAEVRVTYDAAPVPEPMVKAKRKRLDPDLLLNRLTLIVATAALSLLTANHIDELVPAYERLAEFVHRFIWH